METVTRADWAELLGNSLYTFGGGGCHILYDDLPAGEYTIRLYRVKDEVVLYSGTTYTAVVK